MYYTAAGGKLSYTCLKPLQETGGKNQVFTLANSTLNDFSKKVEQNRDTNYIGYTYIDTCSNLEYYKSNSNSFPGMIKLLPFLMYPREPMSDCIFLASV